MPLSAAEFRHSPRSSRAQARAVLAACTNQELVEAMRRHDRLAWGEWDGRFRGMLEQFARRAGIPRWDAAVCINEVLEKEALRFAVSEQPLPDALHAYLCAAVRHRFLSDRKVAERRAQAYIAASEADGVVHSVASEHAIRSSRGPLAADSRPFPLVKLARWLERELSEDEQILLSWLAEHVPRRVIASWLGINYEAAKKRCTRLCARVQALASRYEHGADPEERAAIAAFLSRVRPTPETRKEPDGG